MIDFTENSSNCNTYVPVDKVRDTSQYIDENGGQMAYRPEDYVKLLRLDVPINLFDFKGDIDIFNI